MTLLAVLLVVIWHVMMQQSLPPAHPGGMTDKLVVCPQKCVDFRNSCLPGFVNVCCKNHWEAGGESSGG